MLRSVTICIIITNFMIIVFGVLAASRASRVHQLTQVQLGLVEQLKDDWSIVPFTSLQLREDNCGDGLEPVFVRRWKGTVDGCDRREEEKKDRYKVQTIKGF